MPEKTRNALLSGIVKLPPQKNAAQPCPELQLKMEILEAAKKIASDALSAQFNKEINEEYFSILTEYQRYS